MSQEWIQKALKNKPQTLLRSPEPQIGESTKPRKKYKKSTTQRKKEQRKRRREASASSKTKTKRKPGRPQRKDLIGLSAGDKYLHMRAEKDDKARWIEAATLSGLTLSGWIRLVLNRVSRAEIYKDTKMNNA